MSKVRVLVVDDQEPFRRAMASVVDATEGFEVVGSATTGEESLLMAGQLAPDLVLMDVNLPGIDGIEAARQLTADARTAPWSSCCRRTTRTRSGRPSGWRPSTSPKGRSVRTGSQLLGRRPPGRPERADSSSSARRGGW